MGCNMAKPICFIKIEQITRRATGVEAPKHQKKANQSKNQDNIILSPFDIVGDIAIMRLPETTSKNEANLIAEALMQKHRQVKTVLRQVGAVKGNFRLRALRWVKGERKFETLHREFGCVFRVNLKQCYFSPRLSYERMRVAGLVKPKETVLNMFAGVGSFSILTAKIWTR